jgi:hypothetical protein
MSFHQFKREINSNFKRNGESSRSDKKLSPSVDVKSLRSQVKKVMDDNEHLEAQCNKFAHFFVEERRRQIILTYSDSGEQDLSIDINLNRK